MDFSLKEDQQLFQSSVRDFLKSECPLSLVKEIELSNNDYSAELHKKMVDLGWFSIFIPEEYGGSGGGWAELAILYYEAGRVLLQSLHYSTICLGAQTIINLGTETQKREILPFIASGDVFVSLAIAEAESDTNSDFFTTTAINENDHYIINGTKIFVYGGQDAHWIITATRTEGDITLFLINRNEKGLTCLPMDNIGGLPLYEIVYDNVKVSENEIIGKLNEGMVINEIIDKAKIMLCAYMLGLTEASFEMVLDFSKDRIAFERPIGSFQAIQHKFVDMWISIEELKWLVNSTAWKMSENIPCSQDRAMTQLRTAQVCPSITATAVHYFGAMGIMLDHNISMFYRRAKAAQLNLNNMESLQESIAKESGFIY